MIKKKVVCKVVHISSRRSFSMSGVNRYCKRYHPNTIVKAVKGTVGIMCFKAKDYAKRFIINQCIWPDSELEIIDVRPIGKANYPKSICVQTAEDALNNFYKDESVITTYPPYGTVCYKSVEVLT